MNYVNREAVQDYGDRPIPELKRLEEAPPASVASYVPPPDNDPLPWEDRKESLHVL